MPVPRLPARPSPSAIATRSSCKRRGSRSTRPRSGWPGCNAWPRKAGGIIPCRPTQKEAEDYYHYSIVEHADWSAVDGILALKNISPQTVPMQEYVLKRSQYAQGMGGLPIVGDPDFVAKQIADLSQAGLTGIG